MYIIQIFVYSGNEDTIFKEHPLIEHLADATLYVTRANYTEKKLLEHTIELFKHKKLKNMAYAVNAVGANKSYGYNYGYDYGYGS